PCVHLDIFKHELDHLLEIGVLVLTQESEWASPSFIIPIKDGHTISLTNHIKYSKKAFRIQFFTKLDINKEYYAFELDKESQISVT
ncbi:hypothetical protein ACHAW6_001044, partial [Cyclotella cf. meneghiniana]